MNSSQRLWRALFVVFLLASLCGGLALPAMQGTPARAAPQRQSAGDVVISEFRFSGPEGGNDEFIELYNPKSIPVTLTGLKIMGSNSSAGTGERFSFGAVTLQPGQYYLLVNSSASAGLLSVQDAAYSPGIVDDGGIAITLADGTTIIEAVGLSLGSAYKEGTPLSALSGSANQSYERRTGGSAGNCNDTDNNAADFVLNLPSDPQNSSSPPLPCLRVTNVTSTPTSGTYAVGNPDILIQVTFSSTVDVTGSPRLLLETGVTDTPAIYETGSGTNTLTFRYTIGAGDSTSDLDYVSSDSLTLNGGTIIGAIGNAVLTLPVPGLSGSLGANSQVVIDNGVLPSVISFRRQTPNSELTNAATLTFRATFSEAVINVDTNDFIATGTTGTPTSVTRRNSSVYDVTVSGGNLATLSTGTVGLDLNTPPTLDITNVDGTKQLATTEPSASNDETYTLDKGVPTVTVNQKTTPPAQADPVDILPVNFAVVFSEAIDVNTFTANDITQNGTANSITWSIVDSGDHINFTLSATSLASNGTIIPSIRAGRVKDLAGNDNTASTSTDNSVTFSDTIQPTVTVNQASGQPDPTSTLPVRFTVLFSEPIDTRIFIPSDILQNGTATGITWTIADLGNHMTFTLTAITVSGGGTLIPSIPANRVTDLVGNVNLASTSTDNTVMFGTSSASVVISEFRSIGPSGANDEFIELYNPTSNWIDISGWKINASNDTGNTSLRATIPAATILRSGQYYLIANNGSGGYSGNVTPNLNYGSGITDAGGIALVRADNVMVDQVGMGTGSAYKEGSTLPPLSGNSNQSYERKLGGTAGSCQDTNSNANDFSNISPSNPHNYSSPLSLCGTSQPGLSTTTTTITADSPDPSLVNGSVNVSVSVTGGSTPTGIVNITGANTNCTITLNSSGTGTCIARFSSVGVKTLTAIYLGDNTHLSSSDTESHQVTAVAPTKTRVPTPPPPPPLVAINEFVPRPGHDWNLDGVVNTGDEYIELLNHGVIDVNLSGYSLDDEVNIGSSPYRLPGITIKPGQRIVFYGSETGLLLSDGGDGVRLLKPNGQLGDAYNYFVVRFPDQSYCRLPDNGGLDDWNQNCFPTPGLQNSLSKSNIGPSTAGNDETLCPIADTLPLDFMFAECTPFGANIWNPAYWDRFGWFDEKYLPESSGKWPVFVD